MKQIFLSLLFLCGITYSQISDFNKTCDLNVPEDTWAGSIYFTKWDDDDLTDILWVDHISTYCEYSKLKFLKNIGTLSSPEYKDMGFIKNEKGDTISFEHG